MYIWFVKVSWYICSNFNNLYLLRVVRTSWRRSWRTIWSICLLQGWALFWQVIMRIRIAMMKKQIDVGKYSNFSFFRRDHGHALLALSVLRPQEDWRSQSLIFFLFKSYVDCWVFRSQNLKARFGQSLKRQLVGCLNSIANLTNWSTLVQVIWLLHDIWCLKFK